MSKSIKEITPILGTAMAGGYYAGRIRLDDGTVYALILAPKDEGEHMPVKWINDNADVPGALSYNDGLANTQAMAEAGSELAQWARGLRIDDSDGWYLPSQDELEVIYRNLKPTTEQNWCYSRSGINLSAIDPTIPYMPDNPAQTMTEEFQDGGAQAFSDDVYWSSTQHIAEIASAWAQDFGGGDQYDVITSRKFRARAVRRLAI